MPKPFLKFFHIIIPHDCQTAVTVVLTVKEYLYTFRHRVSSDTYFPNMIALKERKEKKNPENFNTLKP